MTATERRHTPPDLNTRKENESGEVRLWREEPSKIDQPSQKRGDEVMMAQRALFTRLKLLLM